MAEFELALPPYLTETDKSKLLAQLKGFPTGNFYGTVFDSEPVQGDAWRGFAILDFETGERESVVGLVVSNSCDIARANDPDPGQNILFTPILKLDAYKQVLREQGHHDVYIENQLGLIRAQNIHRIFYLPANGTVYPEMIALLDGIRPQPLSSLMGATRYFTLSTYGWYVLLMKLSVHFTRMTDGVERTDR